MIEMTEKEFNDFIGRFPEILNSIKELLKLEKLNFDLNEVDLVEDIYKNNRENPQEIDLEKKQLDEIFVCYMGTFALWHFGGEWICNIGYPKSKKKGEVFICDSRGRKGEDSVPFSPEHWRCAIDIGQDFEPQSETFRKWFRYHELSPELILKPVRNYK